MKRTLPLILACAAVFGARAAALEVTGTKVLTTRGDYDSALITGSLVISNAASVAVKGPILFGCQAGKTASVSVSGKASFLDVYRKDAADGSKPEDWIWSGVTVGAGGGAGKFTVKDSVGFGHGTVILGRPTPEMGLWLGGVLVASDAIANSSAAGTLDLLELGGKGIADITAITNCATVPVRLRFNGGTLRLHQAGTRNNIPYEVAAGAELVFESVNGNDISIHKVGFSPRFFSGAGTIRTSGAGAFVIHEAGETRTTWTLEKGGSQMKWGNAGGLTVDALTDVKVAATDALPSGAQAGVVRLRGDSSETCARLDLCGYDSKVFGLVTEGAAYVTNSAGAVTLTFGTGDENGLLDADLRGSMALVKTGSGTLTMAGVTANALTLAAGTISVTNDCAFDTIDFQQGVLFIDGATVTCRAFDSATTEGTTLRFANGGRLVMTGSGTTLALAELDGDGVLEKAGAGDLTLTTTEAITAGICVRKGRVTLAGKGVSKTASLEIAAGAAFDFGSVANTSIGGLTCDLANGAGTLSNFLPASSGCLNLVNADSVTAGTVLPISITSLTDPDGLIGWSVALDGEVKSGFRVTVSGGKLAIASMGMIHFVR